ncbi:hypothetical protein C0J52_19000 [Blattella germanica]|nr:hypothetical protein C0J52_19000 [Blattella germanica]
MKTRVCGPQEQMSIRRLSSDSYWEFPPDAISNLASIQCLQSLISYVEQWRHQQFSLAYATGLDYNLLCVSTSLAATRNFLYNMLAS